MESVNSLTITTTATEGFNSSSSSLISQERNPVLFVSLNNGEKTSLKFSQNVRNPKSLLDVRLNATTPYNNEEQINKLNLVKCQYLAQDKTSFSLQKDETQNLIVDDRNESTNGNIENYLYPFASRPLLNNTSLGGTPLLQSDISSQISDVTENIVDNVNSNQSFMSNPKKGSYKLGDIYQRTERTGSTTLPSTYINSDIGDCDSNYQSEPLQFQKQTDANYIQGCFLERPSSIVSVTTNPFDFYPDNNNESFLPSTANSPPQPSSLLLEQKSDSSLESKNIGIDAKKKFDSLNSRYDSFIYHNLNSTLKTTCLVQNHQINSSSIIGNQINEALTNSLNRRQNCSNTQISTAVFKGWNLPSPGQFLQDAFLYDNYKELEYYEDKTFNSNAEKINPSSDYDLSIKSLNISKISVIDHHHHHHHHPFNSVTIENTFEGKKPLILPTKHRVGANRNENQTENPLFSSKNSPLILPNPLVLKDSTYDSHFLNRNQDLKSIQEFPNGTNCFKSCCTLAQPLSPNDNVTNMQKSGYEHENQYKNNGNQLQKDERDFDVIKENEKIKELKSEIGYNPITTNQTPMVTPEIYFHPDYTFTLPPSFTINSSVSISEFNNRITHEYDIYGYERLGDERNLESLCNLVFPSDNIKGVYASIELNSQFLNITQQASKFSEASNLFKCGVIQNTKIKDENNIPVAILLDVDS